MRPILQIISLLALIALTLPPVIFLAGGPGNAAVDGDSNSDIEEAILFSADHHRFVLNKMGLAYLHATGQLP